MTQSGRGEIIVIAVGDVEAHVLKHVCVSSQGVRPAMSYRRCLA